IIPGATSRRFFLDRASVTRPGGRAHSRSRPANRLATGADTAALYPPGAGTMSLWRARVDQFAEQIGGLEETDPSRQVSSFQLLPPAGLLPRAALDFLTTTQAQALPSLTPGVAPDRASVSRFFPPSFAVEAVPLPLEDLDAALAASAPLAPFDLATG